jgi:hypothetical protein
MRARNCRRLVGVFTPNRVLHGTTNDVPHLQACVQGIVGDLSENILAWLEDLLTHAMDEPALLKLLRLFFQLCRNYNLELHPGKCVLFSKMVRWWGRVISFIRLYEGASFSPDRLHNRPEAARYLLTLVTACSDRDTHTLSKFS